MTILDDAMTAAATEHTGAMIALVPTDADLDRLALDPAIEGAEPKDELHLTLFYLGEAADISDGVRDQILDAVTDAVRIYDDPIQGNAFGVNMWNPDSEDPAWVLAVGDVEENALASVRHRVGSELAAVSEFTTMPEQHTPWQPHVCILYSSKTDLVTELIPRLGEITFDRVRVAFAGVVHDISLQTATMIASSDHDHSALEGVGSIPWHIVNEHAECPADRPYAVVKDADGEVEGCHSSRADAEEQMAALYANEGDSSTADVEAAGGKPSEGTKKDKRLQENKTTAGTETFVSEKPWDGAASRFSDEQYQRAAAACDPASKGSIKERCFLPHHEPEGALSRAGVHAAAGRVGSLTGRSPEAVSRAKGHLRRHYGELGEDVPDGLKAKADTVTADLSESEGAYATWEGTLVVEGVETGDGREFATDALTWADPPLTFRWKKEDAHGGQHDVTVAIGRIDEVWRDGNQIRGRGVVDLGSPDGAEAARRLANETLRGVSIDADDITDADVEIIWPEVDEDAEGMSELMQMFAPPEKMIFHAGRIRAATLCDIPAFVEATVKLTDAAGEPPLAASVNSTTAQTVEATSDGSWDPGANEMRLPDLMEATLTLAAYAWVDPALLADPQIEIGRGSCKFIHHEIAEDGTVGPANLTACASGIGILNRGRVDLSPTDKRAVYNHLAKHLRDAGQEPEPFADSTGGALVAHAAGEPWRPPRGWFADPKLGQLVPIIVTNDGRVYGHAAQWDLCHIGYGDECVKPPRENEHPYFLTGELICDDETTVAVGQITVDTGHAPLYARAQAAAEHYDNTGAVVADVTIGNDDFGIWVAGAVRPDADHSRVHKLRASGQVSPDWRRIGGELRMVALLTVNGSGYQVPKPQARVASGNVQALVAAGMVNVGTAGQPDMSEEDLNKRAFRILRANLAKRVHQ